MAPNFGKYINITCAQPLICTIVLTILNRSSADCSVAIDVLITSSSQSITLASTRCRWRCPRTWRVGSKYGCCPNVSSTMASSSMCHDAIAWCSHSQDARVVRNIRHLCESHIEFGDCTNHSTERSLRVCPSNFTFASRCYFIPNSCWEASRSQRWQSSSYIGTFVLVFNPQFDVDKIQNHSGPIYITAQFGICPSCQNHGRLEKY